MDSPSVLPQAPRWPLLFVGLIIGASAGAAVLWYTTHFDDSPDVIDSSTASTMPVMAETRDLISYLEWDGTLSSGAPGTVAASTRGTITRNAAVGDAIEAGDTIAEIDGAPVIALYGSVPQFRAMNTQVDNGADVHQLEENLVALGFDPGETVTVDEEFTYNTGLMVSRWEESLGFDNPDGVVAEGQIAFIDGPSEVVSTTAVGSQAVQGQPLLSTVTVAESGFLALPRTVNALTDLAEVNTELTPGVVLGTALIGDSDVPVIGVDAEPNVDRVDAVEVEIPMGGHLVESIITDEELVEAGRPMFRYEIEQGSIDTAIAVADSGTFSLGTELEIELPDASLITAIVTEQSEVARTVQTGQTTSTVIDIVIEPTESLGDTFTSGPVVIRTQDTAILGAVVVPVRTLISFIEGGHAVDFDDGRRVAVELGTFDDGWVEITNGAVRAGDMLLAPT